MSPCYATNLACKNNVSLKDCFRQTKLLREDEYKDLIENIFNTLRNNVASGKVYRNLRPAAQMVKMSWNSELAYFARLDVRRCTLLPRPCMCSPDFYRVGSLADIYGYPNDNSTLSIHTTIRRITSSWMSEVRSITPSNRRHLPPKDEVNEIIFSTTLLLIEHNSQFGCAVLRYASGLYRYLTLSCAFGTDNEEGKRLYRWGLRPGIRCRYRDAKYTNLCAAGEKYQHSLAYRKMDSVKLSKRF
ncbi:antigen 5 like allergen Cul n 1 [Drosophila grimshawi]|nr:antigen 5 like allergen Cul n 1 [Drosophila grimshawi]